MRGIRIAAGLALLVALVAGCTSPGEEKPEVVSPFADCAALPDAPEPTQAPDVVLHCFTGGAEVRIGQLRGPMVINLWASWCLPCRDELPALQRLADTGKVQVLGVITGDDRSRSAETGQDLGITFPAVFDRDQRLLTALGLKALPVSLFVAADGSVVVHTVPVLTDETLAAAVAQHLGVQL